MVCYMRVHLSKKSLNITNLKSLLQLLGYILYNKKHSVTKMAMVLIEHFDIPILFYKIVVKAD